MIEIEVSESPEHEVRLVPGPAATKAAGTGAADLKPLNGLFSIGTPVVHPFTDELAAQDKNLGQFLVREHDHHFVLVHIACTFRPNHNTPFESASLQIQLQSTGGTDAIAWSMSPERVTDNVTYSRKVTIGSDLKILQLGAEAGTSGERRDVSIEASGLLQSDPAWEFTRTGSVAISGSHRLFLVVRSPRERTVTGSLELSMTVRQLRMGLIPYKVELPDVESASFRY